MTRDTPIVEIDVVMYDCGGRCNARKYTFDGEVSGRVRFAELSRYFGRGVESFPRGSVVLQRRTPRGGWMAESVELARYDWPYRERPRSILDSLARENDARSVDAPEEPDEYRLGPLSRDVAPTEADGAGV